MAGKEDFYSGENLEAILAAMEDNLLNQNEDFSAQIDEVVGELGGNQPACSFSCDQCDKICKKNEVSQDIKTPSMLKLGKMDLLPRKKIKQRLNPSSTPYILKHM